MVITHVSKSWDDPPSKPIGGPPKNKQLLGDPASRPKSMGNCGWKKAPGKWSYNIAMEIHLFQYEIHLQMVDFPASYVSLPEGNCSNIP